MDGEHRCTGYVGGGRVAYRSRERGMDATGHGDSLSHCSALELGHSKLVGGDRLPCLLKYSRLRTKPRCFVTEYTGRSVSLRADAPETVAISSSLTVSRQVNAAFPPVPFIACFISVSRLASSRSFFPRLAFSSSAISCSSSRLRKRR